MSEILFAAQIALCRLHGCMSRQELNLLQLSSTVMTQLGAAMPNPGLCRIEYEACAFGAELAHQDDQVDSA
jgi:hypothetical protein